MKCFNVFYILIVGLLTSCTSSPTWEGKNSAKKSSAEENSKKLLLLRVGMNKSDVLKIMGPPDKTESYDLGKGTAVEFYLYETEKRSHQDKDSTDVQFTPLAFQNNKLIGWGRNYYEKVIHHEIDIKESDIEFGTIPDFNIYEVEEFH